MVCLSLVLPFLVITPRPSPHQNTTTLILSLSFTSHHRLLPHLTSSYLEYLEPHIPPTSFLPAATLLLSFSSHLFSPWHFRYPNLDTDLIPPLHRNQIFGRRNRSELIENCCGQHFSNFIHLTTRPRTVQLFLLDAVGFRTRYTSCSAASQFAAVTSLHLFTASTPADRSKTPTPRDSWILCVQNCLCLFSTTSPFL